MGCNFRCFSPEVARSVQLETGSYLAGTCKSLCQQERARSGAWNINGLGTPFQCSNRFLDPFCQWRLRGQWAML